MSNGEIIKEIERNFSEINNTPKKQIPLLLNTIIRQIGRLSVADKAIEIELSNTILNLKNILTSEIAFAELQKKSGGEQRVFGESFFKSVFLVKEDLNSSLSKIV